MTEDTIHLMEFREIFNSEWQSYCDMQCECAQAFTSDNKPYKITCEFHEQYTEEGKRK